MTRSPHGRKNVGVPFRSGDLGKELLATFFGLGYAPVASGTFGTLGGVALAALIGTVWPGVYLPAVLGLTLIFVLVGAPVGDWAEKRWGRKDPGQYVLDEVCGYLIAVAWPVFPGWTHLGIAFFAFRVADVVKAPPGGRLEKVPGGWGILLDDLVAGVWTLAFLFILRTAFPGFLAT